MSNVILEISKYFGGGFLATLLDRLVSLKEQSGLNAKQLTSELGISTTSFTDWGKGKGSPSVDTLVKFSDYFHVSLDWLVRGEEFSTPIKLDFSSYETKELLNKFNNLSPELRDKLMTYIDGMLAAVTASTEKGKRLSG